MERQLAAHVEAAMAGYGWPGCAAAIVRRGESPVLRAWGNADLATGRPVTPDTGFRIGSTGKTVTALAVVGLVEQGLVSLDEPVQQHLPGYRLVEHAGEPVLLRHLLSHTAGLGDLLRWSDITRPRAGTGVRRGAARPTLTERYAQGVSFPLPPGIVWRYANHGIALAGAVVESVTGLDFEAAAAKLVLEPLGMTDTGFGPEWLDDPRTATGYGRGTKPVPLLDISVPPAGSAVSRASDMAAYLTALLGEGGNAAGSAVSPETFALLVRRAHQPDRRTTGTGLAWWLDDLDGHRVYRHGGAWAGFRSCCVVAPDDGVALWLGVNAEQDVIEQVGLELLRAVLGIRTAAQELDDLAGGAGPAVLPPEGRYVPVGTGLSTITSWTEHRRGLRVRHSRDGAVLHGGGGWRHGFALRPLGGGDPGLFGADLGQHDPVSKGFTTVQHLGTRSQPMLLVNGRSPYVAARSPRPWAGVRELELSCRDQLEALSER